MIGIDGSGRDRISEEKAFALTYSPPFAFFIPLFFFSFLFPLLFSLFFLEDLICTCIKISKGFTWNEDKKEPFFKRVCKNVKQNVKGYVHLRGI